MHKKEAKKIDTPRPKCGRGAKLPDTLRTAIIVAKTEGKTVNKISADLGVSTATINRITRDASDMVSNVTIDSIKKGLSDKFSRLSSKALDTISEDKLNQTGAYQLSLIASIAADKMRLLDGQSTHNVSLIARLKDDDDL